MLQNIREGIQGPWAIGIVALIVISFVFTGVSSYISSSNTNAVAIVNGTEIPASVLERAYDGERARMESQFGEAINSLFANESYVTQFRNDILDRLVNDELVAQRATELGLRVSDEQIKETIAIMPDFQVGGRFDNEYYKNAIRRAGYTPGEFAEYLRGQMTKQQLVSALTGTSFSLSYQAETMLALQSQTRTAQSIEIDIAKYQDTISLTEQEIQDYYSANLPRFDTQEQVKLAYVTLSVLDLEPTVEVSDDEVAAYYAENQALYTTEEVRRVSHILFESGEDAEAAQLKAQETLTQLQSGESFETLAEQKSDDILSAEIGGDLGEIDRSQYEGAFGDAAFNLASVGDISDIVETEFGFHIIKLTELTEAKTTPLSDISDSIEAEIRTSKATDEYFSLQQEMARLAFEEPDSLEAVAEVTNKPIIETAFFQNNQLPAGVDYPQIANVAFSSELIDEQVNSELLEIGNDTVIVVRVAEHKPQRTQTIEEVTAQIESSLKVDKAQEQANLYAQDIKTALMDGEDVTELLAQQSLEWTLNEGLTRNATELSQAMLESIFALNTQDGENVSVVTIPGGNVGIVKLVSVAEATTLDETEQTSLAQQIAGTQSQQTYENFIQALRAQAEIQLIAL